MYKEKERFGTTLGGCFSLCARCGLTFYVIVMVIAFFGYRDYGTQIVDMYVPLKDPHVDELRAIDVVPVVEIVSTTTHKVVTDIYQVSFSLVYYDESAAIAAGPEVVESRPAIDCKTYSEKYLNNDNFKEYVDLFSAELFDLPELFWCPDFDGFKIYGSYHHGQAIRTDVTLNSDIQAMLAAGAMTVDELKDQLSQTNIFLMTLTQQFNP
jgi:hypothetical protein